MHPPFRWFVLSYILCFCLLISLSTGTTFQNLGNYCWDSSTYTPNLSYRNNNSAVGGGDRSNATTLYGLFTCRSDGLAGGCGGCVSDANTTNLGLCPKEKTDIIWYDYCILRYSNGSADQLVTLTSNNESRTNGVSFRQVVGNTVEQVTGDGSGERFATQEANVTASNPRIYTLGLCTPDLSDNNCTTCLTTAIQERISSLGGNRSSITPICNVKYEVSSSYNRTVASAPPPPPPPPPPSRSRPPIQSPPPNSPTTPGKTLTSDPWGHFSVSRIEELFLLSACLVCCCSGLKL